MADDSAASAVPNPFPTPASRLWLVLAGLNGACAVAMGAYSWHALGTDANAREMMSFAVTYQMWHALALLGIAALAGRGAGVLVQVAGAMFLGGIVLFSGTLYVLGLTGRVLLPYAAPIGGGLMILAWLFLSLAGGIALWKRRSAQ
ncbi:MAG: DUF423 domain-containing protein [Magnetospirillum sp. WYHS-4]